MENKNLITRRGMLQKIICYKKDGETYFEIIIKFQDGILTKKLNALENIFHLLKKYDICVPNMFVTLQYINEDEKYKCSCSLFNDEDCYLPLMIEVCPEFNELNGIKSDVDIVNYGLTFVQDKVLRISGECPKELKKKHYFIEKINDNSDETNNNYIECIDDFNLGSKIPAYTRAFLSISNDYSNENWNGPQSYGGFTATTGIGYITKQNNGTGLYELGGYDFKVSYIFDENENFELYEDTEIHLKGNKENNIEIICKLKDLNKFESFKKIASRLSEDLDFLLLQNYRLAEERKIYCKEYGKRFCLVSSKQYIEKCHEIIDFVDKETGRLHDLNNYIDFFELEHELPF